MAKVAVIGMVGNSAFMSVEKFNQPGETVVAKSVHYEPGGKGYNQAVAAGRYGVKTSFLGAVGTEFYSEIRDFLTKDGITPVLCQKQESTAFATILTDASGQNQVTVYQGAKLTVADVEAYEPYIAQADVLLLNNEVPENVNIRAAEIAEENGTFVILNPAPARPIGKDLADRVQLFTPNEHELEMVKNRTNLVVTLGGEGCFLKESGIKVPAVPVEKVVDTTGAGDTFNGVLAAELAMGATLEQAAKKAVTAAGISVTRPFAATAIPYGEELTEKR